MAEMLYRVALKCLDRPLLSQLTHVDTHVCGAGREFRGTFPVHIQSRGCVEGKLLLTLPGHSIPNYSRLQNDIVNI